ncbi:MAG TPA: hypothetical protein VGK59_20595 [Ohtaekwangia sp.]
MKLKSLLCISILAASTFFLNGCGDDEKSPSLLFKSSEGDVIDLKGANLYLASEDEYNGHIYRDYFISDGELKEGAENGWGLGHYNGATYYLAIELGVPAGDDFAAGDYPLSNWSEAEADENWSYIELKNENEYYNSTYNMDLVTVSGGFDDGDKMTVKFKGELTYYYDYTEESGWEEKDVTGEFYYSGKIIDKRPL